MTPHGDNPRGRWERKADLDDPEPQGPYAVAVKLADKYGPLAVIAGILIYFMANNLQSATDQTLKELRQHATDTSWYMRQTCINMSVLAGTPKELCEPPNRHP